MFAHLGATPTPAPQPNAPPRARGPVAPPREPFAPLHALAAFGGRAADVYRAAGATDLDLGLKGLDLLGRPGLATQAAASSPTPGEAFTRARRALMHGLSPEHIAQNRRTTLSRIPDPGFFDRGASVQSLIDRSLPEFRPLEEGAADMALDPVSYFGGSGLLEKGVNVAGKAALYGGVKGAGALQRVVTAAAASKPATAVAGALRGAPVDPADVERAMKGVGKIGGAAFDALTPRGRLVRRSIEEAPFNPRKPLSSINKPFKDADAAATIKNQVVNTQRGFTAAGQKAYDDALRGLSNEDKQTVFRLVNGAKPSEIPGTIRPELFTAAEKLDNLYKGVLHVEGSRPVRRALAAAGFTLPEPLAPFDTSVRGIFNANNVRAPYLPHGRQFGDADLADLRAENRPGLTEDDLLGKGSTGNVKQPGTLADASDPAKKARLDTSHLQDTERQDAINRARFATAGRAIAGRDASRALAARFAPAKPVMRTVRGEKPDVGEIYRMAQTGLDAQQKRIVNMLQQGAKPEDVAARIGVAPEAVTRNLQQRAQSVIDAIGYQPEARQVATGAVRHDFADVPRHIKESFLREPAPSKAAVPSIMRAVRAAANLPKYAFFFNPLPHMGNITTLGALSDPRSTALGAARFAAAHPEFSGAVAGAGVGGYENGPEGAAEGAVAGLGLGHGLRRFTPVTRAALGSETRAIDTATKAGAIPFNPEREVPSLIRAIPGLRQTYAGSNRMLWRYDEAQKAARYDSLIKSGVDPATAAQRVGQDLIDYGNRSGLTGAVSYGSQFPSYRVKMPGAVVRSIIRHPERTLAAARLAPAQAGLEQDSGLGDKSTVRSYLPLADTIRGANAPEDYLRSSLSYPLRDVLSGFNAGNLAPWAHPPEHMTDKEAEYEKHYFTYGQPVDKATVATEVLGSIPGGDEALTAANLNPFTRSQAPFTGIGDAANAVLRDQVQASTRSRIRDAAKPETAYSKIAKAYLKTHPDAKESEVDRFIRMYLKQGHRLIAH